MAKKNENKKQDKRQRRRRRRRRAERDALGFGLLGPLPKYLRSSNQRQLRRQAERTVKRAYRPEEKKIDAQERKVQAIAQKRAEDNKYYNDWIAAQSEELRAHAEAADAELVKRQSEIQQQAEGAEQAIRQRLLEQASQNVGTVSDPQDAEAFDVSEETQYGEDQVEAEATRTTQSIGTQAEQAAAYAASNIALAASNEFTRQHDLSQALKATAAARQELRLSRADAKAQEMARLLDKEIQKAGMVVDMKNIAAQLAIDLKNFRLNKKNYRLQRRVSLGELRQGRRELRETERSNRAGERNDRRDDKKKGGNKNKQEKREEQRKVQRQVKHIINNTISAIASNPNWQDIAARDPNALVRKLIQRGVAEPVFARAAVDLVYKGKLSDASRQALRNIGFNIPPKWRG